MIRRHGHQVALSLLLLVAPMAGVAQDSPEDALRRASRLEKDGALRQAQKIYEDFLAGHPDHIRALNVQYRLAVCFDNMGDPEQAIEQFAKLVEAGKGKKFQHMADAMMHMAKLQGSLNRHEAAVVTLRQLIGEGAGLYDAEAHNLCAGYLAVLAEKTKDPKKYEESAAIFNILRRKPNTKLAQDAAYKLAIVWLKANRIDSAKEAVEDFARDYPTHPHAPRLFIKVARFYYQKKAYVEAKAVCEQVKTLYPEKPEAVEAAYLVALCFKGAGKHSLAVRQLSSIAKQQRKNRPIAVEAVFEIAQLYHKELQEPDKAMEYYKLAAETAGSSEPRQKQIREYSYFQIAEHFFQNKNWASALDSYLVLRKMGTQVNILPRILACQAQLSPDGSVSLSAKSEAEVDFIKQRIADNPGTALAAQAEIFLLDSHLHGALAGRTRTSTWKALAPIAQGYEALLKKYSEPVLKQGDLKAYLYLQMGHCHGAVAGPAQSGIPVDVETKALWTKGIALYEQALTTSPQTLSKVDILENVAALAIRLGDRPKAFDAYKRLYEATGLGADGIEEEKRAEKEQRPSDYIRGMVATADTAQLLDEAVATVMAIIEKAPDSREAREARYGLADLYFMMKRYSDAAKAFKDYIKIHGPAQNADGSVSPTARTPKGTKEEIERLYDAGVHVARCWFFQGHKANMIEAYAWLAENQPASPHACEAWYYVANNMSAGAGDVAAKEEKAETFWKQIVNASMDFGSKAYAGSFRPWIRKNEVSPSAVKYVDSAILKAGEIYGELGKHGVAAAILGQHLGLWADKKPLPGADMARYALGRELIQAGDIDKMAGVYRPYIDGMRGDRFRGSALMMLGHYGTQAGLYDDAREAYAALLDEYGLPNDVDKDGKPIPIPTAQRMRPQAKWNGIRLKPPEQWDVGKIRFSLGYMYWKKEAWDAAVKALLPFYGSDDVDLLESESRPEAIFMLGKSYGMLRDYPDAIGALRRLIDTYPDFQPCEEAYSDLVRLCYGGKDWAALGKAYTAFVAKYPESDRRPHVDLYHALCLVSTGQVKAGIAKLQDLAEADTYEDVKADALYHIAMHVIRGSTPRHEAALKLLNRSVELFPRERALVEAARCASSLERWPEAYALLDRAVREFPKGDPVVLKEARDMLKGVVRENTKLQNK